MLRYKFPEFVKINLALIFLFTALSSWQIHNINQNTLTGILLLIFAMLAVIKTIDLILGLKKGLANHRHPFWRVLVSMRSRSSSLQLLLQFIFRSFDAASRMSDLSVRLYAPRETAAGGFSSLGCRI
jgi:hypothetical protein